MCILYIYEFEQPRKDSQDIKIANHNVYYALDDNGDLEYQDEYGRWNSMNQVVPRKEFYHDTTKVGFVVKMMLNVNQKSLTFIKNGVDAGIAYSDIDTSKEYSMALCITFYGKQSVELIKLSICYQRPRLYIR